MAKVAKVAKVAKEEKEDTTAALVDMEASVAREERKDTTEASHPKILDVKSFVTSLTYQMVSTTTLVKAIVTKVSFSKFVLKVLADSDMVARVARVAREERVDTTAVASVDTEALVDMVAKVERDRRVVVVSSFKNVLPYVHSHHRPVIQVRTVTDLENTVVVAAKEQIENLL